MTSSVDKLRRYWHPVVFLAWVIFLGLLLINRRHTDFLRPEFGLLLTVALVIAAAFMAAGLFDRRTVRTDTPAVLRAAVLLVPVFYWMIAPDAILGHHVFMKRFIGTTAGIQDGARASAEAPAVPESALSGRPSDAPQTFLDIFRDPQLYEGRHVVLTGMILRDDRLKPHFGGLNTVVYRFLINCCAADALPLTIGLDAEPVMDFTGEQWVRADGVFELRRIGDQTIPILSATRVTPVAPPEVPYLY